MTNSTTPGTVYAFREYDGYYLVVAGQKFAHGPVGDVWWLGTGHPEDPPPACRNEGNSYAWDQLRELEQVDIARLPEQLLAGAMAAALS